MGSKKYYDTTITQREVRILGPSDFDGYEYNKPNGLWELVEYVGVEDAAGQPLRVWTPKYALQYDLIRDYSKVKIVGA